jgi:Tn3 transposase DDE domain
MHSFQPKSILIDIDNHTNFLRHFLHAGGDSRLSPATRRHNALAALIAIGCNIGPHRMAIASGSRTGCR